MENKLKSLIRGQEEPDRIRAALEWKRNGGKVIGTVSSYVPEEIIYAAGMLPFRLIGTRKENVALARVYRPSIEQCLYCTHVIQSELEGNLEFLDGLVATDRDQELVRLWDVITYLRQGKKFFGYVLHAPRVYQESELVYPRFAKEIRTFRRELEGFGGREISDESLRHALSVYNRTRSLLSDISELRKGEAPPLSGAEALGLTISSMVLPKGEFNEALQALLPTLRERTVSLPKLHPRLLVSSGGLLDNPAYIEMVEEAGCLVAMDDLGTGSGDFHTMVDEGSEDPVEALARYYLTNSTPPRMLRWEAEGQQIIRMVKDFAIDAVMQLILRYDGYAELRAPFVSKQLSAAGIPNIVLVRGYHLENVGQLQTKVGAFLEMWEASKAREWGHS